MLSPHARAWKKRLSDLAMAEMGQKVPMHGPVEVFVSMGSARAGTRDADGPVKLALDALNGIVYVDDRQVWRLIATKTKADPEWLSICVRPIDIT